MKSSVVSPPQARGRGIEFLPDAFVTRPDLILTNSLNPTERDDMNQGPNTDAERLLHEHLRRSRHAATYEEARLECKAAQEQLDKVDPLRRRILESIVSMECADSAEHFGDYAAAVAYNEALLADDPDDQVYLLSLLRLYRELGRSHDADRILRRSGILAEQSKDAAVLAMLASAGYLPGEEPARAERLEDAIRSHQDMLAAEPASSSRRHARLQYDLGELYRYKAQGLKGAERVQSLRDAIAAYQAALGGYSAETFPKEHSVVKQRLTEAERQLREAPAVS